MNGNAKKMRLSGRIIKRTAIRFVIVFVYVCAFCYLAKFKGAWQVTVNLKQQQQQQLIHWSVLDGSSTTHRTGYGSILEYIDTAAEPRLSSYPRIQWSKGKRCSSNYTMQGREGVLGQSMKKHFSDNFHWQTINAKRNDSFLFSAFYDPRSNPAAVKIIGLSTGGRSRIDYCQLWFKDDPIPEYMPARFQYITLDATNRYAPSFHTCYLDHGKIPVSVSLVTDKCNESPNNLLRVHYNPKSIRPIRNFTVCVTPFNFNYDNYLQLVEMIEVNRLYGAQKFIFYNHSTGQNILPYIRSYEDEGIVEVIPWKVPIVVDTWPHNPHLTPEVHYFGQVAALNDCLYRNLFSSRFVVFTDLDELIVPRGQHRTWIEVLEATTREFMGGNPPYDEDRQFPGAYVFRNTFFRYDCGNDTLMQNDKLVHSLMLRTQLTTNRESFVYPWYSRSKYIAWTKMTSSVGVHL